MAYTYKLTDFDKTVVGKLALTNTYASLDDSYESNLISYSENLKIFKDVIIGELTGNYYIDSSGISYYEVKLFCPIWSKDGSPRYLTVVNKAEINIITDTEARKQPRMVFKDYRDRSQNYVYEFGSGNYDFYSNTYSSRFEWGSEFLRNWEALNPTKTKSGSYEANHENLFPYTDTSYNQLCYNRNFDTLGSQDVIDTYFGNIGYDTYLSAFCKWKYSNYGGITEEGINLKYSIGYPVWKDFFGQYKGNSFDNSPIIKLAIFSPLNNVVVQRNEVSVYGNLYFAGKMKKEHGIVYSKTNSAPTISDTKLADTSEYKNLYKSLPTLKGLEYDTNYFARIYYILEDDTVVYSNVFTFKTDIIGSKPIQTRSGENAYRRTPYSVYLSFGGEDGDADITNCVFKIGKTLDTLSVVSPTRYTFRYKDSLLTNMKAWSLECTPLYGLEENTNYFFRVEVTNQYGTLVIDKMNLLTNVSDKWAKYLEFNYFTTTLTWDVPFLYHESIVQSTIFENKVTLNAGITTPGRSAVLEHGFVLSAKNELVTIESNDIIKAFPGSPVSEDKTFTSEITGLTQGTKYFYRAYAKNSYGTAYSGPSSSFITKGNAISNNISPTYTNPQLSTSVVKVSDGYAILSGNVISNGNYTITKKGICWGPRDNPKYLINSSKEGVVANGSFNIDIRDLENNKIYFARTFVVTAPIVEGEVPETFYGNQVDFTPTNGAVIPTYPTIKTLTPTIPIWDKNGSWWALSSGIVITATGNTSITTYGVMVSDLIPTTLGEADNSFTGSLNSNILITNLPVSSTKYITGYAVASDSHVVFANSIEITLGDEPAPVVPVVCGCLIDSEYELENQRLKVTITGTGDFNANGFNNFWYSFSPPVNGRLIVDDTKHKTRANSFVYYLSNIAGTIYFTGSVMRNGEPYDDVWSEIKSFTATGAPGPNPPSPDPDPNPVVIPDNIFSIPNTNLYVGKEYVYKKRKWLYNGYAWERDYTYSPSASVTPASGGSSEYQSIMPVDYALSDVNSAENVDFLIKQENKLSVISKYVDWVGIEQEPRYLNLLFDVDITKFDLNKDATLFYGNKSTAVTLQRNIDNDTTTQLYITFSGLVNNHIDESLYDLMYEIEAEADVYVLFDEQLTNHIIPVNNAKFRPEDIDFDNFEEANY